MELVLSSRPIFILIGLQWLLVNFAVAEQKPNHILFYKQLAASPQEILSGKLKIPRPEEHSTESRAVLISPSFNPEANNSTLSIPIEGGEFFSLALFQAQPLNSIQAIYSPSGKNRLDQTSEVVTIHQPEAGTWQIALKKPLNSSKQEVLLVSFPNPSLKLTTHLAHYHLLVGNEISLNATVSDATISQALMRVMKPDGSLQKIIMTNEAGMNDGIFTGSFLAQQAGEHRIQIQVSGITSWGTPFTRTSEHIVPISKPFFQFMRHAKVMPPFQTTTGKVRIPIQFSVKPETDSSPPNELFLSAELWGHDKNGKPLPVTWFGGITHPQKNEDKWYFIQTIDSRWLAFSHALPPFELREVKLSHPDSFIPLSNHSKISLKEAKRLSPFLHSHSPMTPDMEMWMGPKPQSHPTPSPYPLVSAALFDEQPLPLPFLQEKRLLLVHGYCTGDAWPEQDFSSDAIMPLFPYKNLSNDAFARLLYDYGSSFASYGIVGHSQGGLAALHLYVFYWSGLDEAKGERLIQTLGAPFGGTILATKVSYIGTVLGRGCGPIFDLTPDGAALWLSNIPQWAREKVYYYVTSKEDSACDSLTNLFLEPSNDGIVETVRAQLPGGKFVNHTLGECHAEGMNGASQAKNKVRNHEMDKLAAR